MEPLTMALIAAGISAGTQAIGAGLERRAGSQAAAEAFTEEEAERLRQLQALQAAGQLGLTEEQAGVLEAQARTQQAAQARQSQAERLAAQAARPASARDVFLQQAAAEAARHRQSLMKGCCVSRQSSRQRQRSRLRYSSSCFSVHGQLPLSQGAQGQALKRSAQVRHRPLMCSVHRRSRLPWKKRALKRCLKSTSLKRSTRTGLMYRGHHANESGHTL